MTTFQCRALMEYLPVRYSATEQQKRDRREIYQFKDGYCSSHIMDTNIGLINNRLQP